MSPNASKCHIYLSLNPLISRRTPSSTTVTCKTVFASRSQEDKDVSVGLEDIRGKFKVLGEEFMTLQDRLAQVKLTPRKIEGCLVVYRGGIPIAPPPRPPSVMPPRGSLFWVSPPLVLPLQESPHRFPVCLRYTLFTSVSAEKEAPKT